MCMYVCVMCILDFISYIIVICMYYKLTELNHAVQCNIQLKFNVRLKIMKSLVGKI